LTTLYTPLTHHASIAALSSAVESTTPCSKSRVWTFNSGATDHVVSEAGIFTHFAEARGEPVLVVDKVQGKGDVRMRVSSQHLVLKNVLLVPGIARNLLSRIAAMRMLALPA
jgi:hypothetical protein